MAMRWLLARKMQVVDGGRSMVAVGIVAARVRREIRVSHKR